MTRATQLDAETPANERARIKPLLTPSGSKLELIRAYGQFWRADQIDWDAGGRADDGLPNFALLGHLGKLSRNATLVANVKEQRGLYILYGNYGPYYVGVTTERGLGTRLHEHHHKDIHKGRWDRFSWFGFCAVEPPAKSPGPATLVSMAMSSEATVVRSKVIAQMESLLIHAMGPRNLHLDPASLVSEEWQQVTRAEREQGLKQLG